VWPKKSLDVIWSPIVEPVFHTDGYRPGIG
jgi:hypothetical protein